MASIIALMAKLPEMDCVTILLCNLQFTCD